jgi:redox-sensing transcriptional repressor
VAAFDIKPELIGKEIYGIPVYHISELEAFCSEHRVPIGIITTPPDVAQGIADTFCRVGIMAIWNFALTRLDVPEGVLVQNENLASSLAMLSHHITK